MLIICKRVEKETKVEIREISEGNLKVEENKTFIYIMLSFNKFFLEDFLKKSSFLEEKNNGGDD